MHMQSGGKITIDSLDFSEDSGRFRPELIGSGREPDFLFGRLKLQADAPWSNKRLNHGSVCFWCEHISFLALSSAVLSCQLGKEMMSYQGMQVFEHIEHLNVLFSLHEQWEQMLTSANKASHLFKNKSSYFAMFNRQLILRFVAFLWAWTSSSSSETSAAFSGLVLPRGPTGHTGDISGRTIPRWLEINNWLP